jgi:hypothetical protein
MKKNCNDADAALKFTKPLRTPRLHIYHMDTVSKLIAKKTGYTNLVKELADLPGSSLNSLLLELFQIKARKLKPAALLNEFKKNRFVAPSTVDPIAFRELEIRCLQLAKARGFTPITLSPITVFGTCASVGYVDQNNVLTALRGTEVVSDATNVFALLMATEFKKRGNRSIIKYAATQRHVRAQSLTNPAFTAHFSIFCMATGGMDTGNFSFELEQLLDHINAHYSVFTDDFDKNKLVVRIYLKQENKAFEEKLRKAFESFNQLVPIKIEKQSDVGDYYQMIRFRFYLQHKGDEINLSDGGLVDWTQKLIPNKKHRLIISGVGTELIHKIKQQQI